MHIYICVTFTDFNQIYSSNLLSTSCRYNMPSMCSFNMTCPPEATSSFHSLSDIAKIFGIVFGIILGLVFLISIVLIIYLLFCKRKPSVQVWTDSYPSLPVYGQSMPMFSSVHYPQASQLNPQKITEEPPPAYEEINANQVSTTNQNLSTTS